MLDLGAATCEIDDFAGECIATIRTVIYEIYF